MGMDDLTDLERAAVSVALCGDPSSWGPHGHERLRELHTLAAAHIAPGHPIHESIERRDDKPGWLAFALVAEHIECLSFNASSKLSRRALWAVAYIVRRIGLAPGDDVTAFALDMRETMTKYVRRMEAANGGKGV